MPFHLVTDINDALNAAGLGGYLGNFKFEVDDKNGGAEADAARHGTAGCFDLVLDLNAQPALAVEVPPPGYFATRGDRCGLSRWVSSARSMVM